MKRLDQCRIWATPVLAAILVVLLVVYARKAGFLSTAWLTNHKDALSAISGASTAAGVLVGGILAYYRFFRGRTLATRAELAIAVEVIRSPGTKLLHSITVSIKNVGTVTIWEPRPTIEVTTRHADGSTSSFSIAKWYEMPEQPAESSRLSGLDSGETGDFFTQQLFDSSIWAVTYAAIVTCATGESWAKLKTVANRASEEEP